ncbi:bifunctional precorrin-2 dehydrogenase/sirohydrochlorin ferrochelatase [Pedobacter sp. HMF7647]|uniref:precorrin-2 dehydrogenase n=1 Tax=Hufsiella arboris TaxID=2695275 RepID=A0A7K1YB04_9SPHI|nr:bifunctional precorrin-2 dehydrogenase/sirohydrochlorin ferrochelatase [Hufsiella arboris]MXV51765.1 bifunctional precorrin-2 dehydrogenase/sirohydrochlorin ferrochelatase [Hufsiella arboris]
MQANNIEDGNTLFPVFLKLENLNLLLVGGGNVALEKLEAIFKNSPNARVKLVAIDIFNLTRAFLSDHKIPYEERPFYENDLEGVNLAIIAVNDHDASRQIKEACAGRNVLANVADTPAQCDFYLGSVVKKGNLKVAISTNGKSPTVAKRLKETLNAALPDEMDSLLSNISAIRDNLKGDFAEKVRQLDKLTKNLSPDQSAGR